MNRPTAIVAVVAGYPLVETIVLLSLTVSRPLYFPTPYQLIVVFGQLILIPGMAVLMSRAVYGPFQMLRRTFAIAVYCVLLIPASIILVFGPILLLAWCYDINWILFASALPVVVPADLLGLLCLVRKSGKWSVSAEVERRLCEGKEGTAKGERIARSRSIRFAVCIPALLVLPIFLFLPETWAIASHLSQRDSTSLTGYKIAIPMTWVILFHNKSSDGYSSISGIAGRGLGRGVDPLRYDSLSSWYVGTGFFERNDRADFDRPSDWEILQRRDLTVGSEILTCVDRWPTYRYWPAPSGRARVAHVKCSSPGGFNAGFDGMRS